MTPDKTLARAVAFLFVTTMVAGFAESLAVLPLLSTPLANLASHGDLLLAGVFLLLYLSLGVMGIALFLHPVVKRHSGLVAAAYLGFRIVEGVFLLVGAVVLLFLVALGRASLEAEPAVLTGYQALVPLALEVRMAGYQIAMTILGLNSLVLFGLLWKVRLLPRWLSGLGLVGYTMLLLSAVLALCGVVDTTGAGGLLYVPGGLFELVVLPAWLTVKGFDPGSPRGGRGRTSSPPPLSS